MRKIFTLVLAFGIICGLCGCSKQSALANDSDYSSSVSQSVSAPANYSDYQSYTVDDHGNILDSKTGSLIMNSKLAVDSSGNIVLKENEQIVVTSKQVQENKELQTFSQNTSSQNVPSKAKNEKTGNSSKAPKINSSSTVRASSSATSKSAASTNPAPHNEPIPLDKAKNWDSLYGDKEWMLFSTDPSRMRLEGSTAFICRFSAGQDLHAAISVEFYCLLDKWQYPLNKDTVVRTMNGQKYVRTWWSGYMGDLSSTVGSEDIVTLELRCYDATGHNWLSDELKFERTGNNSLQLISGDYHEFGLKNGDVFTR